jgi:hypothetical protein
MIESIERELISRRRMFSLLGLAVALGLAVPPIDADAQTSGMERRQERRQGRVQRRYERRGGQPAQNPPAPSQPAQKQ